MVRCSPCALLIAAVAAGSCTASGQRTRSPCVLPDLTKVDEGVRAQARERFATLTQKIQNSRLPAAELGGAYGALGMVLHAAEYYDAAERCYIDAQTLAAGHVHWPYYPRRVYSSQGQTAKAQAEYTRVLELRPDDVPALIWLGRLHLDQGRPENAEPLFTRALTREPNSVAALAGLGRAALTKHDYAGAAKHLEQALSIDPEADSLHSPLAMAYRGLGQLDKAEPHLRQWRNREIRFSDPLGEELDLLLESGLSYELRGVRALEAQNWTAAASFFRRGLELTPANTPLQRSLHHKLGTASFMVGDAKGAVDQFEEVIRLSPAAGIDESAAKAHYSLGVLMASSGREESAVKHFSAAAGYQPSYVEAHVALGDALRRTGQAKASLAPYQEALKINPRAGQARIGYAFGLVRLRRYLEARDWLAESMKLYPDHPEYAHALARLLAAAPDDRVRDGRQASELVRNLLNGIKTTDLGETMAMTLAELGQYDDAAAVQRGVIDAARQAGLKDALPRMADNLRRYEHDQPCRRPWRDDDPVHRPGPPVSPELAARVPAARANR